MSSCVHAALPPSRTHLCPLRFFTAPILSSRSYLRLPQLSKAIVSKLQPYSKQRNAKYSPLMHFEGLWTLYTCHRCAPQAKDSSKTSRLRADCRSFRAVLLFKLTSTGFVNIFSKPSNFSTLRNEWLFNAFKYCSYL